MNIKANVLDRQYYKYKDEYDKNVINILEKGWYILGEEVQKFEEEYANYIGTKYCVGLASGLDALIIAFRSLGIKDGDEVIVQANTYIASVMGITINGAKPIFVEPDEYYNINCHEIKKKITNKTKAILVVHLYGMASNMEEICNLCKSNNLYLIEDCAQAHGAMFKNKKVGSFGDIGCWSFYPSKNLGAFGDAGAITTNNSKIAEKIKILRNYGSEKRYQNKYIGYNSRLDEIQAGLLRIKLNHINELTRERADLAKQYLNRINNKKIQLPKIQKDSTHVWHLFLIQCKQRDELIKYLDMHNIQTIIHYPIPPHLSEAYSYLGYKEGDFPITEEYSKTILSLPLYIGMTDEEINYVIDIINNF